MLKFVLLFIIIVVLFILFWSRRLRNPYSMTLICGKKGSGKTNAGVSLAIKYLNKKDKEWSKDDKKFHDFRWKVYSNIQMPGLTGIRYFDDVEKLGVFTFPEHSVVIIDEINTLPGWDNREFKQMNKATISWMRYCRQYKIKCFFYPRRGTAIKRSVLWWTKYLLLAISRPFLQSYVVLTSVSRLKTQL